MPSSTLCSNIGNGLAGGPAMGCPLISKRPAWQGHSKTLASSCQITLQLRWVQIDEKIVSLSPASVLAQTKPLCGRTNQPSLIKNSYESIETLFGSRSSTFPKSAHLPVPLFIAGAIKYEARGTPVTIVAPPANAAVLRKARRPDLPCY